MTNPDEVPGMGGDAGRSASRGDRSTRSSSVDPQSLVPRETVRELLRAMANVELIRLEKSTRWNRETHWNRLEAAQARVKRLHEELGL